MKDALPSPYASFGQRAAALFINLFLFAVVTSLLPIMVLRLSGGAIDLLIIEGISGWLFLVVLAVCWVKFRGSPDRKSVV